MERDEVWQHTIDQRLALRDVLRDLSPEESGPPSLCAGWRVRDVAGHVIAGPQLGLVDTVKVMGGMWRGYNGMILRDGQRRGARRWPTSSRSTTSGPRSARARSPSPTSSRSIDAIVHTQDIVRPLGRTVAAPPEAAAVAADRVRDPRRPLRHPPPLQRAPHGRHRHRLGPRHRPRAARPDDRAADDRAPVARRPTRRSDPSGALTDWAGDRSAPDGPDRGLARARARHRCVRRPRPQPRPGARRRCSRSSRRAGRPGGRRHRPAHRRHDGQPGITFVGYLLAVLVILPLGLLWSLGERSRGATAVLIVALLTVAFLVLRLVQIHAAA